jgi:hypothetical protein|tara:strand:- start:50 stop:538 length:489 start_codon:yes stop_codon:yes gene_type:complete
MYFQKFILLVPVLQKTNYIFSFSKDIIPQIRGGYSVFKYQSQEDIYRYKSKLRKSHKENIPYHVEDHHLIPQEFKKHNVIVSSKFNINCSNNLLIMPGRLSKDFFTKNIIHQSHPHYNKKIKIYLNKIDESDCRDNQQYQVWLLLKYLEQSILRHDKEIFQK